jgi:hypothetical protein
VATVAVAAPLKPLLKPVLSVTEIWKPRTSPAPMVALNVTAFSASSYCALVAVPLNVNVFVAASQVAVIGLPCGAV